MFPTMIINLNIAGNILITPGLETDKETILQRFWPKLARIAASYERSPELQQELQQEMALAIWQAVERFRGDSVLDTYLYKIAHNVAVAHIKKQLRQIKTSAETIEFAALDSLEQNIVRQQQLDRLMQAIRQLPVLQRQLVTLSLDGVKQQDIAEILGISENNVAVRMNRAKKALQQLMTATPSGNSNQEYQ